MVEVAKIIVGFSVTQALSEAQAQTKAEVYAEAVDGLPAWAIAAARGMWARGETEGLTGRIDPSFPPAPAHVRAMAQAALAVPRCEALRLRRLLEAEVRIERTAEQRGEMLRRIGGILPKATGDTGTALCRSANPATDRRESGA